MAVQKRIVFFLVSLLAVCIAGAQVPGEPLLKVKAPEKFRAIFKTTKGSFTIEAYRNWSPLGVDRLYQLITSGFYNNTSLFRVERNFVTQFGISEERNTNRFWDRHKIIDEPAKTKNTKGVIAFARGGKNDRATQLFINNTDNPLLDTVVRQGLKGYTPVARVVKGLETTASFYDRYGRSTLAIQDSVYKYGNRYLEKNYPGLDRIVSATLVP